MKVFIPIYTSSGTTVEGKQYVCTDNNVTIEQAEEYYCKKYNVIKTEQATYEPTFSGLKEIASGAMGTVLR